MISYTLGGSGSPGISAIPRSLAAKSSIRRSDAVVTVEAAGGCYIRNNTAMRPEGLGAARSNEAGTTGIEYALIVLLIGLVLISLQNSIGASVVGFFMSVASGL